MKAALRRKERVRVSLSLTEKEAQHLKTYLGKIIRTVAAHPVFLLNEKDIQEIDKLWDALEDAGVEELT